MRTWQTWSRQSFARGSFFFRSSIRKAIGAASSRRTQCSRPITFIRSEEHTPELPSCSTPVVCVSGGGCVSRGGVFFFSQQHPEGSWCGELEADSMLEADYIYLHTQLESGDPERLKRALTEMMRYQNEDGSWSIYPGGPGNISLSVKCYFSAKLMGIGADDPRLAKCREWVLAHGGVVACNTFTKMYPCGLGQYDYDAVPAIPPEIVLFPNWFYFNIYEISAWSRSILVPLAIIYAKKPYKKIPPEQGIDELFVGGRANSILRLRRDRKSIFSWRNFFIVLDRLMHWAEAVHLRPVRTLALRKAEKWLLERLEMSDGLGAIYPAMLNAIIALRCLGYSEDDPQGS